MTAHLPVDDALMQAFADSIAARIGLHFPRERWHELWRGACAWADASGDAGPVDSIFRWIEEEPSRAAVESLATHLSVGETYFFREPASFETLASQVLPPLIAARRAAGRRLRIWSAGCASGEECYSLAIVLQRLIPDLAQWDVRIVGSDIHPGLLATARQAVYGDWSFRGRPGSTSPEHFEVIDGEWVRVRPELRSLVDFDFVNLADEPRVDEKGAMDLVLCRHVLMYFEPARAQRLVARLRRCLADDGWLVIGIVEGGHRPLAGFSDERVGGGAFHRKTRFIGDVVPPPVVARPLAKPASLGAPQHRGQSVLEEVLAQCRIELIVDRCNAELHHLQALVHQQLGQPELARHALRRALFLDPGNAAAHLARARLRESLRVQGLVR